MKEKTLNVYEYGLVMSQTTVCAAQAFRTKVVVYNTIESKSSYSSKLQLVVDKI